jgi:hypothetical protein
VTIPDGWVVPVIEVAVANGPPEPAAPHVPLLSVSDCTASVLEASPDWLAVWASVKLVRLPIKKLVELLYDTGSPPLATLPLTVRAPPVGAVVSLTNEVSVVLVFPAASEPVTVYELGLLGLALHVNALEVYGPTPVATLSAAWIHPVVAMFGKAADTGPEPESATVSVSWKEPLALPL